MATQDQQSPKTALKSKLKEFFLDQLRDFYRAEVFSLLDEECRPLAVRLVQINTTVLGNWPVFRLCTPKIELWK
jgi:hypothetical protein